MKTTNFKSVATLLTLLFIFSVKAQVINPGSVLKRKVNDRINNKIDNTIDKGLDDAEAAAKKKKSDSIAKAAAGTTENSTTDNANKEATFKTYTKYDFISGEKVKSIEDFSQDALGDFPGKWNTNSSGEIVNLEGRTGKWLQISKQGVFMPEFVTELPENFTYEFDLAVNPQFSFYSTELSIDFCALKTPDNYTDWMQYSGNRTGLELKLHPTSAGNNSGRSQINYFSSTTHQATIDNNVAVNQLSAFDNRTVVHVAVWRQGQRVRVYINEEKIWDLPRAFEKLIKYNAIVFSLGNMHEPNDRYLISNLKLAIGAPDTRNKLITEGKYVSRGILFDVNSATIKPESYGALKEIANVLKENPTVKIKIVGHTDSDGDDKANLELSKKRAQAVKDMLIKEFGIDASRMETDGKGESVPAETNTTVEAKANNRRVEFIKL
ncbi:MAG: OmpA family protein [Bacteroidota bacterium]